MHRVKSTRLTRHMEACRPHADGANESHDMRMLILSPVKVNQNRMTISCARGS
jgi:hypothetical protein